MSPAQPNLYPRRILLAVTGLTPQVVTETLYALIHAEPAFVPTEVRLITTGEGAARARLALLSQEPGWFRRFCQDYDLPSIAFDTSHIQVLADARGNPLDDIRSPEDNRRAADLISETVRALTADAASALHVSLAGGRKTMGYYLGYALSLYGRPQDRLSHVLVNEPFESSWDFFYPTPYERVIQTRDQKLANCREARVTLAEIPFVRLREGLPARLLDGHAVFSEAVDAANRVLAAPQLKLCMANAGVFADGERIDLGPTEFVVLYWLASRARTDEPEIDWSRPEAAEDFLRHARQVMHPASAEYERLEKALRWRRGDPKAMGEYFEPQKSRVNKAFAKALGDWAAQRYQIRRSGPRGASRYALPLTAAQIEIGA
ncbi:MAG: CRISPR-associated ring nuclease Csm6 [Thiobacillaceae bacterium]